MRRGGRSRPALTLEPIPSLGILRLVEGESPTEPPTENGLPRGGRVMPLALEVTRIGRDSRNNVVLADPAVSRAHARLHYTFDGWEIENVSARNLLWVEGREVHPGGRAPVAPGERITLGHTALQLLAPTADPFLPPDGEEPLTQTSSGIAVLGASGAQILGPGVTLQFALRGRVRPGAGWALAGAAALVFLVSAIATLGTTTLVGQSAFAAGGLGRVVSALTIPLIPALGVAVLVSLLDRYEREPPVTLLGAFLWGAVIAIPPVLFVERWLDDAVLGGLAGGMTRALAQALNAGVTEETIKGAGLLVLLWALRDEFDNVTDGAIYGALIGAGFAMVENFVYFASTPRADLGFLIFGRVVLGWLSHSTFTACFGIGLGFARETRDRRRQWLAPVIGFAAAVLLHTLFDAVAFGADVLAGGASADAAALLALGTLLADYGPLFAAQAALLRIVLAALRREAAVVREYLAAEVADGVVTPDEYALLQDASLRARAEHHYGLAYGPRAYLTARALYQTATGLAFRKWHVALGDPPKPTPRQPEEVYRVRIARLRRSLLRQVWRGRRPRRRERARTAAPTRPLFG